MKSNEPLFDGPELAARLAVLPGWRASNGWLRREYTTDGWRSTMLAVNAIAFVAEAGNHHPDLEVHWGRVVVMMQTGGPRHCHGPILSAACVVGINACASNSPGPVEHRAGGRDGNAARAA